MGAVPGTGIASATYKREVVASRAIVAANHPLASVAGAEILALGGNAVDAAVATLFALSVVEPMMVSPFGAGFFVIRDGRTGETITIDNYATVPLRATPDMFTPILGSLDYETVGQENDIGYLAVAVPGALKGWAHAVARYGRLPFSRLLEPAIRHAADGFPASAYLVQLIADGQAALSRFPATAEVFLPGGQLPTVGQRIVRADYARTLRQIADEGPETMYTGALARVIADDMAANGGLVTLDDLADYRVVERAPIRSTYRGHEILSMAPPSSGGTHIAQILNLLEGFDVGRGDLAFGTPGYQHLFAEALKIAFADRRRYMGDPGTTPVPVEWLTSKAYADERRAGIDLARAQDHAAGEGAEVARFLGGEGANTTHLTLIDDEGTIVSTTQTLNSAFGSKVTCPGTGMLLDNCMVLMDPEPGRANSIAGGKRILSSMSPTIVLRDGAPFMALGTPGGKRIFAAVAQGIINVIDHGMTLQEAVEAPRCWTQGEDLELEADFPDLDRLREELTARGHRVTIVEKVAGGMNGVQVTPDGLLHGAACWRADGVPLGISGGTARPAKTSGVPLSVDDARRSRRIGGKMSDRLMGTPTRASVTAIIVLLVALVSSYYTVEIKDKAATAETHVFLVGGSHVTMLTTDVRAVDNYFPNDFDRARFTVQCGTYSGADKENAIKKILDGGQPVQKVLVLSVSSAKKANVCIAEGDNEVFSGIQIRVVRVGESTLPAGPVNEVALSRSQSWWEYLLGLVPLAATTFAGAVLSVGLGRQQQ